MELVQSSHSFYNQTVHANPRANSVLLDAAKIADAGKYVNTETDDDFITQTLPFPFVFYGQSYTTVNVFPGGFVTLGDKTFTSQICPLKNLTLDGSGGRRAKVTMGSSDDSSFFVIVWSDAAVSGLEFEAILYETGSVIFRYGGVPADLTNVENGRYFVGIATAFDKNENDDEKKRIQYKVDIAGHHIRSGITVRYDPIPDYREDEEATEKLIARGGDDSAAAIAAGVVCSMIGMSFALAMVALHAVRHPTSCPGQILVRMRMTGYRLFSDDNGHNYNSSSSVVVHQTHRDSVSASTTENLVTATD